MGKPGAPGVLSSLLQIGGVYSSIVKSKRIRPEVFPSPGEPLTR
jgi:hypothetical protein